MVQIVYGNEKYFRSFHEALSQVANERIYLEMIQPPPYEAVAGYQQGLIQRNGPTYYAIVNEKVVGWADIFPDDNPRMSHRGSLGMGIISDYRGQGIGTKLLKSAIEKAREMGLEKVELNVYTTNTGAIKLYKKMGFNEEGLIKNYRKLDGQYFDSIVMALQLV